MVRDKDTDDFKDKVIPLAIGENLGICFDWEVIAL